MSSTVKKIFIAWVKDYNIIVHASKKYRKIYIQKYLGSKNKTILPMKHKYKHTYIESLINFVYKIIYNNNYYFLRKVNDNVISAQCLLGDTYEILHMITLHFVLIFQTLCHLPLCLLQAQLWHLKQVIINN